MWQRWNQSTHIFEKSDDNGANWVPLPLSGSIISEGTISSARLPSIPGSLLAAVWPVGSIFISAVATNPNTLLGFGTWAAFGTGRTLVGINGADADFDTVEEVGGAKTHTLSTAEMPSHTHTQNSHNHTQDAHNHTQDSHTHTINDPGHAHTYNVDSSGGAVICSMETINGGTRSVSTNTTGITGTNATTATNQAATATNQAATATNQNTGGDGAHNNLQPYIVVYMWKRTA